jgi:hypothetical protein
MQNIDFYEGTTAKPLSPQFDRQNMDFFTRMAQSHVHEMERSRKKASRTIFIIGALCIISFTTGIIVGLKFAGGSERGIVDETTYNAVKNIGTRVSDLLNDPKIKNADSRSYPVEEYPYVIKVKEGLTDEHARKIASLLSGQGNTVILTKNGDMIDLYTGPYKTVAEAKSSMGKIAQQSNIAAQDGLKLLQRK